MVFSYVDKKEQQRTNSRQSLERYLFYFNRYSTHEQSLQLEMKLKKKVATKMDQIANATKAYVEGKCLEQGVEVLSQCRQTLMYSYVFAFFLQKDNNSQIFEDNQKDLEAATENLSELLEKDIDGDDFSKLFKQVQDKSRYVDARRKVLLEHCTEGYDKNFWKFTTAAFR
ncbi:Protein CBG23632 [Caenorhabditis briggsae]|uniref:Protein CBG23632 n=1 Tax=Caenorhabditis briggsae TaxID=6238 RepID=B0K042_CAEBR|nr:Protein CBG23632 [Caenorhabditis briggsae]CAP20437.1 Protein CBG23632 [Caenorhabditis briggsae]